MGKFWAGMKRLILAKIASTGPVPAQETDQTGEKKKAADRISAPYPEILGGRAVSFQSEAWRTSPALQTGGDIRHIAGYSLNR